MSALQRTRHGVLRLHFGTRGGRTVLLRDLQQAPLMIVRPFLLPCGTLMVFVVNPTGGLLGGDCSDIEVRVDGGARVLIVGQSATRIQPDPAGREVVQNVHLRVAAGGRLEYYPERIIPFAGSAFLQTLLAEVEAGGALGLSETLASGRVQMGERLRFEHYASRTEVWQAGRRVYLDHSRLVPDGLALAPGVWGRFDYMATGAWLGDGGVTDWPGQPGRLATGGSAGGTVWLRAVASRGPELDASLSSARELLRRQIFAAAPLHVRR